MKTIYIFLTGPHTFIANTSQNYQIKFDKVLTQ